MSVSKKIGVIFAALHLLAFLLFLLYLYFSADGQSRLVWALWLPVDFPVSLVVLAGFEFITPESQFGESVRGWLPYIVHGLLGTVWWFYIPTIVGNIFSGITRKP